MPLRRLVISLLLGWLSLPALADGLYDVELIVFRQGGQVLPASQPAADDWASGATRCGPDTLQAHAPDAQAARLRSAGYQILLHQHWTQPVYGTSSKVAVSSGENSLDLYPVQAVIDLSAPDDLYLDARIWANQFDESGLVSQSEQISQRLRIQPGKLHYLDHASLGALIRINQ